MLCRSSICASQAKNQRFQTQVWQFLQWNWNQLNLWVHLFISFTVFVFVALVQLPLFQFRGTKYPINAILSFHCAQQKYPSSVGKTLKISKLAVSRSKTQEISYWAEEKNTHSNVFFVEMDTIRITCSF